ncbi:hypothetical protein [Moraxella nonliquefaciens]|nr:hypothetical protein [Moraxella nonliquefaciens]
MPLHHRPNVHHRPNECHQAAPLQSGEHFVTVGVCLVILIDRVQ